jgi:aminodeoxyfutalosine synthase
MWFSLMIASVVLLKMLLLLCLMAVSLCPDLGGVILVEILSDRSGLRDVARKLSRSERLDRDDGIRLYTTPDLAGLGELADARCRERHGLRVFYNVNRHINYSNLCVRSCMFCAFAKRRGDEGGYEYTMDEVLARAAEAEAAGADEVHIVGGLHPDWEYEVYPRMLRLVREAHPGLHLKAFTAVEIDYLADLSGRSVARVLEELHEAGLGSLPGGGAAYRPGFGWARLGSARLGSAVTRRVTRRVK